MSKERQAAILQILEFLQNGGDLETAKKMFKQSFDKVDVAEITEAERQLIAKGLDPREIQYLCNVHVDLFKGNIDEPKENPEFETPGHPVHTFKMENVVIKSLINDALLPDLKRWEDGDDKALGRMRQELKDLSQLKKHYSRKETSMFPIMTRHGITAPPKVMWGVDDEILALIKQANELVNVENPDQSKLDDLVKNLAHEVLEMIIKEEDIMLPMIGEVASAEEWGNVKKEEEQFGYTLIQKPLNWQPKLLKQATGDIALNNLASLVVNFTEGSLNIEQMRAIVDILPMELTFVDKNDKVVFFGGSEHIFSHSKNALGNDVYTCHPQEVIGKVKAIMTAFHEGKKDEFEFSFRKDNKNLIWVRYLAVRNSESEYLGCLEVVQNLTNFEKNFNSGNQN